MDVPKVRSEIADAHQKIADGLGNGHPLWPVVLKLRDEVGLLIDAVLGIDTQKQVADANAAKHAAELDRDAAISDNSNLQGQVAKLNSDLSVMTAKQQDADKRATDAAAKIDELQTQIDAAEAPGA